VRFSVSSSATFVVADARRLPMVLITVIVRSVELPDVVISPPAKRVCPVELDRMTTRASSALLKPRILRASACMSSRVS